jgi:hypothetical protein
VPACLLFSCSHLVISLQYANYAAGKETQSLKAVVGEEALSIEEKRFLGTCCLCPALSGLCSALQARLSLIV